MCVRYLFNNYLGDSTCGQRALYQMGLTGIPIFNVNNNCATGSSALHMANQVVSGGLSDCVLAVGFEKMQRGSLGSTVSCFIYEIIHIFQYVTNSWGGSVIPAAVKMPDNKFARIIKPGRNMPAVKTPDKKFA